jgi:hypothetical protein
MPENTICVCRPGPFGNPNRVERGDDGRWWVVYVCWQAHGWDDYCDGPHLDKRAAAQRAVDLFRRDAEILDQRLFNGIAGHLRGKDLACWCPLDQPCHADVLLEIANAVAEQLAA